ncbi:class I SAM-dependent methyltransferase [Nonomuraea sp. NPDC050691]|uniref:class I SAM-dependent methyltransferase n=1 Tax=Nonomuraea sp. NPDC050691 TaxID=3155661 RepID=UPI0033EB4652
MMGFEPDTYGEAAADIYDSYYERLVPSPEQLAALAGFAGKGRLLEVGAGTGRIAIPLARNGIPVTATDVSRSMLDILRVKCHEGGLDMDIRHVDVARSAVAGTYAAASCLFNTFFMLGDDLRQRRFLANVHACLEPRGVLILENFTPGTSGLGSGDEFVKVKHMSAGRLVIQAIRADRENRVLESQDAIIEDGSIRLVPCVMHYHSAEQIDGMAAEAGFRLRERWSDWQRSAYDDASRKMVSVFEKPA